VPLHRFFAVTSAILILVAIQLAVTGLHELSEARWLPSSKAEMAVLGRSWPMSCFSLFLSLALRR